MVPRRPRFRGQQARRRDPARAPAPMRVCVVAEYYPRRRDPVLGVWAHRQAVAARDAGAEVLVLVLERPLPSAVAGSAPGRGRPPPPARRPPRRARPPPPGAPRRLAGRPVRVA